MGLQEDVCYVDNGSFEELAAMFSGSCLVVGRGGGGWVFQHLHCCGSLYKPWLHTYFLCLLELIMLSWDRYLED